MPVSVFVAVTSAPGTTAPLGSLTMPEMLPLILAQPLTATPKVTAHRSADTWAMDLTLACIPKFAVPVCILKPPRYNSTLPRIRLLSAPPCFLHEGILSHWVQAYSTTG